jgi:hypothetical protein
MSVTLVSLVDDPEQRILQIATARTCSCDFIYLGANDSRLAGECRLRG